MKGNTRMPICQMCVFRFDTENQLQNHILIAHSDWVRKERRRKKEALKQLNKNIVNGNKNTNKVIRKLRKRIGALERNIHEISKKPFYSEPPIYSKGMGKGFYKTKEWRSLRYSILRGCGYCQLCKKTRKDCISIHVDHIKPRSKYPDLELDPNNLQVLCEDCNMGKSNKYEDDFRNPIRPQNPDIDL